MSLIPTPLLHIFDDSEGQFHFTTANRTVLGRAIDSRETLGVGSLPEFTAAMDHLVRQGKTYGRCLFETHGNKSMIFFGDDYINASIIHNWFTNRGWERIFPYVGARIYFSGCSIADDPGGGWDFLDAMGSVFLKLGGGKVFASTGAGRGFMPLGTIHHFMSDTHYSVWLPGGILDGHYKV
ncbi:MAG: hypothetical protein IPN69_09580 [Acidobacteria bacterium]|nr:hypothetical protein [Acidobacteriota bacterium]